MLALLALALPTVALAVNETPKLSFGSSWSEARKIGIRATTLTLDWSKVESKLGEYDLALPKMAEAFYPSQGAEVGLVLRDLNTNRDERPTDLLTRAFDDPAVLRRWMAMADAVLAAMPKARLSWIAVGNEVDASLENDAKIAPYARFLKVARAHLHARRPGLLVGTPLTFEGVRRRAFALRPIMEQGDAAMINYYLTGAAHRPPRVEVPKDLDAMAAFAGTKPLLLTEAGAPSGTICGNSEAAQTAFVETLLREAPRRKVAYVAFQWMNDASPEAVARWGAYYGSKDAAFLDILATLGLRREDGAPKPAWTALTAALRARLPG